MICCSNDFSWITIIYILDFFMLTVIIQIHRENTMAPRKSSTSRSRSASKPKTAAAKAAAKKKAAKSRSSSRSRSTASRSRSTASRSRSRSLSSSGYGMYGTECGPGFQRSAITGTCTKIPCFDTNGNMIPYATRNKYGECQLPRCGKGTVLNPETGRCISTSSDAGKILAFYRQQEMDDLRAQRAAELAAVPKPSFMQGSFSGLFGSLFGSREASQSAHAAAQAAGSAAREAELARHMEARDRRRAMADYAQARKDIARRPYSGMF